MKTMLLTLAAVSALTATAASAQPGYGYDRGHDDRGVFVQGDFGRGDFGRPSFAQPGVAIDAKEAMISQRIDMGIRNHSLTRREAGRLQAELRDIQRQEDMFRHTRPGLTRAEIAQLDFRLDRLSAMVRIDRNDRDGRQYGYGYGR